MKKSDSNEGYNPTKTEKKWQKRWRESGIFKANMDAPAKGAKVAKPANSANSANSANGGRPKYYNLTMFPYPSGDKLHIGHWYNYGPVDTWGRYMRMRGHDVFQPMGFDSFGLPAENYAVKTGVHPAETTRTNIEKMKEQIAAIGGMYDLSPNLETSSPEYYKWTQWVFLKLYEKGLAYRKKAPVNWCKSCKTVLANEQVEDGKCERCKKEVVQKDLTQWFFKITDYADRLLVYEDLDWPEKTMLMQKHWIGRSEGADLRFKVKNFDEAEIEVFTTRPDTLFGATYMVLSPEHPLLAKITTKAREKEVKAYQKQVRSKSEMERTELNKDKSGVFTGAFAVNPVNDEEIPIWIADYVLMTYGTGAIMAVPAHDERDFEFAKKYKIPVRCVVAPEDGDKGVLAGKACFTGSGKMVNSDFLDGLDVEKGKKKIIAWLEKNKLGTGKVNYRLRDWLISRQRYWGAPIPIIYCEACGDENGPAEFPVPEKDLPVKHPHVEDYVPKGKSPLAEAEEFVNTVCPKCGGPAKREVDTMDTFVCSSWYFLRYPDAANEKEAWSKQRVNRWMPVDMYIGGPEHACMHLLYARFIHRVMHDLGLVDAKEPFKRLVHQGMITKDGAKMSKSKGNVVSPDAFVEKFGSDVFRMYLMFMGPFTEGGDWNDRGIMGVARFADRLWRVMENDGASASVASAADGAAGAADGVGAAASKEMDVAVNKTVARLTKGMEEMTFNVAIAALMELTNEALKKGLSVEQKKTIAKILAPLAPHLAEEIWEALGGQWADGKGSVFNESWPEYDEKLLVSDSETYAIQVNGKVRGTIELERGIEKDAALAAAGALANVAKYIEGGKLVKEIFVPGKIIGFVVKS